jgi:uncharacterized protein YbjT (DUF2867 family)
MNVLVVGGHGKVGLRLLELLAHDGNLARGLIRNPEHAADLEAVGAYPVVEDLEVDAASQLDAAVAGSDAVVFAAGAGPGSGPARKRTVDLGGAVKLLESCRRTGVERYVMVSAMGVDRPADFPPEMEPYLDAKREADDALRSSGLAFTIVRPGGLTDEAGTGLIEVASPLDHYGKVTRHDVAATLLETLRRPGTAGVTFDLLNGSIAIPQAVESLIPEPSG